MKSTRKEQRFCQFGLPALIVVVATACAFLAWWFRPFEVESTEWDGLFHTRSTVRRDWKGDLYHYGKTTIRHREGWKAASCDLRGAAYREDEVVNKVFDRSFDWRYWSEDGTETDLAQWFVDLSFVHMPEELGGEPMPIPDGVVDKIRTEVYSETASE